ncbi:FAD-dependent oxidoreductase [Planococcus sp. CP5-4]|uniref:FAD-dependent oxidoreductase n=1 Tax=unclassified Planococcus (in: firmicutes) TaxID=2662419 RepID=UPI001C2238D8|nr:MULTISPECIES: FAD-dependent oxidoreductase [unclassified Planococcus (in: firmicutes)]MBU9674954.1 FAD-dependent oxidoreductase [Planococcus sp. CP5-4_YE]MBV0908417.1 FAD-dependent oxidoreductase [Planococcus sp. CP5-4_UN]MBW6062631.1 FAD-dependent oxidoreductase [Planococcus sp. CP5-4]
MHIYWTKINQIIDESPEVKTYLLNLPEGFTWQEGSHTHFAFEGFNAGDKPNRGLIRHMSICTLPHENSIGITTRIKDQCSEFKSILRNMKPGDEVAIFKTHSNVPLKREGKNVYLLSSGVGLATFRPLVLEYVSNAEGVRSIHSLNVDSSKHYLFQDVFTTSTDTNFTVQFVDSRAEYYEAVKGFADDAGGLFYIVGSDDFLKENIELLRTQGVAREQIVLDKREQSIAEFLPAVQNV